jgi:hypothetical protein
MICVVKNLGFLKVEKKKDVLTLERASMLKEIAKQPTHG